MIGSTTSAKPAPSSSETNRDSMRLRRAVSSISSGLAPVGYRNLAIKPKTSSPDQEEVFDFSHSIGAPLPFGGAHSDAPLPLVVVMVVVQVGASCSHCWGSLAV